MEFDFASLLVLVIIPAIIFAAGALVRHREIVKGKSKILKIVIITIFVVFSLLLLACVVFYINIVDHSPSFYDPFTQYFLVMLGMFYVFALDMIFIFRCLVRWSVHMAKIHHANN